MNLAKKIGIALLALMLFFGAWLTYTLLVPPKPLVQSKKTALKNDSIVNLQKEQDIRADSILTLAESEFLADSTFNTLMKSGEAGYIVQKKEYREISPKAKRINIAVIGVDARLGTLSKRADANHIISIVPDSGYIEIISIPRDTPADAGMKDSTQNKLTIVHSSRGLNTYLREAAKIAKVGPIPYWMELGFSQAMGIIQLLGHRDSKSTLQVLRSRKGLGGDDYQRCYNQGQYIRQMILKHFHRADGIMGELLIRGGLALVQSNLTADNIKGLVYELNKVGFPKETNAIEVKVKPETGIRYKVYNFGDSTTVKNLKSKIEDFNTFMSKKDSSYKKKSLNIAERLYKVLKLASADTAKSPGKVVAKLEPYLQQHAWLQVFDEKQRDEIRTKFGEYLIISYYKLNKPEDARRVYETIQLEKQLFLLDQKQAAQKSVQLPKNLPKSK